MDTHFSGHWPELGCSVTLRYSLPSIVILVTDKNYELKISRVCCSRQVLNHYFWKTQYCQNNTLRPCVWKWCRFTHHSPIRLHTSLSQLKVGRFQPLTQIHTKLTDWDTLCRRVIDWFWNKFYWWFLNVRTTKALELLITSSWYTYWHLQSNDVIIRMYETRQLATAKFDLKHFHLFTFQ